MCQNRIHLVNGGEAKFVRPKVRTASIELLSGQLYQLKRYRHDVIRPGGHSTHELYPNDLCALAILSA